MSQVFALFSALFTNQPGKNAKIHGKQLTSVATMAWRMSGRVIPGQGAEFNSGNSQRLDRTK